MTKKPYAPLPPCAVCHTQHGDPSTRDESCAVLVAEKRIAFLYHNGGTAYAIRYAQAEREDALGNSEKATLFRAEGLALEAKASVRA